MTNDKQPLVNDRKFRFLEWEVYKDSKKLFYLILKIVHSLPQEFRFELGNQIVRSSFSITLNIAEGSGKASDKDLNRFFNIALGSVNETLAGADVLCDNQLISRGKFEEIRQMLYSISSQLGGFKKKLASKS